MTLLSRILGFVRDLVIARAFGAGAATDAFFVAFRLPNLLRRLFAEGAFSQAFVPVLNEYRRRRGEDEARLLVNHVASLLALALAAVSLVGILAAPAVVYISAPGFSQVPAKFDLTVDLLRITTPYIFFISLVAMAGGVLNSYSRFWVPAFTPVLLNLSFIVFALVVAPRLEEPVYALGWAVPMAGLLQLLFQLPFLARLGYLRRPALDLADQGVRRILKLMGPAALGVSVSQVSLIINTIFASFLASGSVSWLYFADRLMEFPTGLLGVALGTILLPGLSRHYADDSSEKFSELLDWGLRLTLLLALPSALALAFLATPLIATLFLHGAFDAHDLDMTRQALMAYSLGLVGLIAVKVLAPGFYARQNIKTPVKIAVFTLAVTQGCNLLFVWHLGHAGLALAISIGALANAGLLFHQLRRHGIYRPRPGWLKFLLQLGVGLAALAGVLALGAANLEWLELSSLARVGWLGVWIAGGAAAYFAALTAAGVRLRDFARKAEA